MCYGVYTVVYIVYMDCFVYVLSCFLTAFFSVLAMLCCWGLSVVTGMPRSICLGIEWRGGLLRRGGLWGFVATVDGLRVTMLGPVTGTEMMGVDNGSGGSESESENNGDRMAYRMVDL